jgi:hypothetical protein
MLDGTDAKATPLYEIEMLGYTEEAAILKYVSIENIYRLAEFSRDTENTDS